MDQIESAERAVVCALFRAFPQTFVWIGGSVLHLLHASPRASYDLDLCPQRDEPPARAVAAVVRSALAELNPALGSEFALQPAEAAGASSFLRLTITEHRTPAFLVDFTRIAGRIRDTTAVVLESLLGPQAVVVPTDSSLLLLKLQALLFRRFLKAADVFDVWFLSSRGVRVSKHQRDLLSGEVRVRELGFAEVKERLNRLTAERFLADLRRRVLPEVFHGWSPARAQSAMQAVVRLVRREIRWA